MLRLTTGEYAALDNRGVCLIDDKCAWVTTDEKPHQTPGTLRSWRWGHSADAQAPFPSDKGMAGEIIANHYRG
jgi:hypothetical protein